jgi:hypothetical protein
VELEEIAAGLRRTPLQFRFTDPNFLWWKTDARLPAVRQVVLPSLNKILTELVQVASIDRTFQKLLVIYPTSRHNLFLPMAIALGYTTLEAKAERDCAVVWTPSPSFRTDYTRTYVGRNSAELAIHKFLPLSTQEPGSNRSWIPPGKSRHPGGPPRVFHSGRPSFFTQPLPTGRKALAVVVDASHRAIPPLHSTILRWAEDAGARALVYVFTNPLHPMIRELATSGFSVLAWSATEAHEPSLEPLAQSSDPFLHSVMPLVRLSHPDFHYQLERVSDQELEPVLDELAKYIHATRGSGLDPLGKRLHRYRQAAFRKLSTLSVPLECHVRHHLGTYHSVSIQRHVGHLIDLAAEVAQKRPDEAEKCRTVATTLQRALKILEVRPPGKASMLARLVREASGRTVIAADNYAQADAIRDALDLANVSNVEAVRIHDLHLLDTCDEVWLLGPPTFFSAYSLRAGIALRTRILCYTLEEKHAISLVQMAHLPSLSTNHVASRRRELSKLLSIEIRQAEPNHQASYVKVRASDGRVIAARTSNSVVSIGRELQEAADWRAQTNEDARPDIEGAALSVSIPASERLNVVFEDGGDIDFRKDDSILRITDKVGNHEIVTASLIRPGDSILVNASNARQSVIESILSELEANPQIGPRAHLVKRWGQQLKRFREEHRLTYNELFEAFSTIDINGRKTRITQTQTLRNWAEGHVVGPHDDNDLRRVAILVKEPLLEATVETTIQAVHVMRRLSQSIMRHIMREAMEGSWKEPVVVDEAYDVHFSDFEGLFQIRQVVHVSSGGE